MIHSNALITNEEILAKEWLCNKCLISNCAEIFPFGLENNIELQNIMQADSLKFLENLPSYEINSKVSDIESLRQCDIDENTVTNIDSRYYSALEFQSMQIKDSMFFTQILMA